ncbi:MAG TPA: sialidase family protein [Candidatus Acidoferrales bacterium]|nr:sialidase family protein [Candidatus Acidoferrales bacterium]
MLVPAAPSVQLYRNVAYSSLDGGETWSKVLEFGGGLWSSDPSCTFGGDTAYYSALVFDYTAEKLSGRTVLYKSLDGAKGWSHILTLPRGDREFLVADKLGKKLLMVETVASKSLAGRTMEPLVLYESTDEGKSFRTSAVISTDGEIASFGYPGGLAPNGTFATAFASVTANQTPLQDQGTVLAGKLRILLYNDRTSPQLTMPLVGDLYSCNAWRNSAPMPSLAVDSGRTVFRGRMYLAWPDSRFGPCRVLFSWSADEGRSWSAPAVLDEDPERVRADVSSDDFHPVVAVNRSGVVGVLWCDRGDSSDALSWRLRFTASLDGGRTFLHSVPLPGPGMTFLEGDQVDLEARSEGGGNPPFRSGGRIRTSFGYWGHALTGGETIGLAADSEGAFHALWIDNRTGTRQLWTARLWVNAVAVENGSTRLAQLQDVSDRIALLFSNIQYDRRTQTVTARAYIQNVSNAAIYCPIEMRVLRVSSKTGIAKLRNSDNLVSGSGAIFDFDSRIPGGVLAPNQRTGGKQILVRLERMPPRIAKGNYEALFQIVTLESVVLGKVRQDTTAAPLGGFGAPAGERPSFGTTRPLRTR